MAGGTASAPVGSIGLRVPDDRDVTSQAPLVERPAQNDIRRPGLGRQRRFGEASGRQLLALSVNCRAHTAFPELRADRQYHQSGDDSRP
jgi:hypothetical protein